MILVSCAEYGCDEMTSIDLPQGNLNDIDIILQERGWHSESGSDTVYDYCPKHAAAQQPASDGGEA